MSIESYKEWRDHHLEMMSEEEHARYLELIKSGKSTRQAIAEVIGEDN